MIESPFSTKEGYAVTEDTVVQLRQPEKISEDALTQILRPGARRLLAQAVAPGVHAVMLLDRAGWHTSSKLSVPDNITLLPLPAKSPELNPTENVWQFLRDNWLSNRVFPSYRDILDHCCFAWNRLVDQPWRITSIGLRDWLMGFDQ